MSQDRSISEKKVRGLFFGASLTAAVTIFQLCLGIRQLVFRTEMHVLYPANYHSDNAPEFWLYFCFSAVGAGVCVHFIAKACMLLVGMKEPADRG
jgi:hypothetical protein